MAGMGSNFNLGVQLKTVPSIMWVITDCVTIIMILSSVLSLYRAVRHLRYCHSVASKLHDLHGNRDVCL
jgi:uncharacterized membrane protein